MPVGSRSGNRRRRLGDRRRRRRPPALEIRPTAVLTSAPVIELETSGRRRSHFRDDLAGVLAGLGATLERVPALIRVLVLMVAVFLGLVAAVYTALAILWPWQP